MISHVQLRAAPDSPEWHLKSSGHYIGWRQEMENWDDFVGVTGLIAVKIGFQMLVEQVNFAGAGSLRILGRKF